MKNLKINSMMWVILALLPAGASLGAESQALEGVFGVDSVSEFTALAFWVPLGEGEAVSGVRWFNNDGQVVFPEFLAVAGDKGNPELLADATVVGQQVSGESLAKSEFLFDQPLATTAGGLYLIWTLPAGSGYTGPGSGGGAGFGYLAGSEENRCWITDDGSDWEAFTVNHQMAMMVIMNTEKSSNVVVLAKPDGPIEVSESPALEVPDIQSIQMVAAPNPFNPVTNIHYQLPQASHTQISVYDVRGRLIRQLLDSVQPQGEHVVQWDGKMTTGQNAPSGMYLVRVKSRDFVGSIRITLAK